MNISLQNVDKVSALLTVNIEKADYQEKVEKVLKTYRQKANIPGFRKGMVPMSLIKKQFGKAVLAEEVDKLMQEKVNEYIHENKVNMLGMPLPNAEKTHNNCRKIHHTDGTYFCTSGTYENVFQAIPQ